MIQVGDKYIDNNYKIYNIDEITGSRIIFSTEYEEYTKGLSHFKAMVKHNILRPFSTKTLSEIASLDNKCFHQWTELELFTSSIIYCNRCNKEK